MSETEPAPPPVPVVHDWGTRRHIQTLVLLAMTAGGLYLCYRLALPFLTAFAWALALAVVCTPLHRRVEAKVKNRTLAALVSVMTVGAVVLGLATFVGQRLVQEAGKGTELVVAKVESGEWRHALEAHPRLAPVADWLERQNPTQTVKTVATWMTTTGASFVQGSLVELLGLVLTFYLLFFFLRDRRTALERLRALSPLTRAEMDRVCVRVGDTIHATIYGTLAVAAAQGLLGGLMFWWLGLPSPFLWGVVMFLLAVVPVLGAFVIWVPAALFLALDGHWGKALILVGWGAAVVGTVDNLLRPVLVGKRLKLHTVLAFISAFGGLLLFGAAGLILGPVVLAVTAVLLEIWRSRTAVEDEAPVAPAELARFENEGGPAVLPAAPAGARSAES